MLQKKNGCYEVYGNPSAESQTRAADKGQDMLAKMFNYDSNEKFNPLLPGAAIDIIPPLIVFVLGQRFFVESVASSGITG